MVYTTERAQTNRRNPWSSADLLPQEVWYVPVLLGGAGRTMWGTAGKELILYRLSLEPPALSTKHATPQRISGERLGGLELVGYDLDAADARPGGRIHLTLYWRVHQAPRALVATSLGGTPLEAHSLGFGNLARYVAEVQPSRDEVVVEDYWVVLPLQIEAGPHLLTVALQDPLQPGETSEDSIVLQDILLGENGQ